jgi:opacity protein-like surface antigen
MKRFLCGLALIALFLGLSSQAASAQNAGFVNYPAIGGVGVKVWGDYGRGVNDDALKSTYLGGRAELGIPVVSFWLGAGAVSPEEIEGAEAEGSEVTFGGGAAFNLIKGPMVPVKVSVQASYGSIASGRFTSDRGRLTTIPFGLAAAANLGTGGVAIVPWAYAFGEYISLSPSEGDSDSKFGYGISGGVELNLTMGLGIYAAIDWSSVDFEGGTDTRTSPVVAAFGLSYKATIPSLGM